MSESVVDGGFIDEPAWASWLVAINISSLQPVSPLAPTGSRAHSAGVDCRAAERGCFGVVGSASGALLPLFLLAIASTVTTAHALQWRSSPASFYSRPPAHTFLGAMPRRAAVDSENEMPQIADTKSKGSKPQEENAAPPAPAVPHALLASAGLSRAADGSYLIADAFVFRQHIERACRDDNAKSELLAALAEAWAEPDALRTALQPTRAAASVSTATSLFGDGGVKDSVVRLLLQCTSVQTSLAQQLLEVLPEHQEELEGAASHAGMPLPKLVLSQFRWLEHVADGNGTTRPPAPLEFEQSPSEIQPVRAARSPAHAHSVAT